MVKKNRSMTLTNEPDGGGGGEMVVGFTNKSYDKQGDVVSDVSIKGFKKVINEKEGIAII